MPSGADRITGTRARGTMDALLDTSTAVALLVADHEAHVRTVEATRGLRLGLSGHAWFETYSVLTRLPAGVRRSPADVHRLLAHDFPSAWFLGADETRALAAEFARRVRRPGGGRGSSARPAAAHQRRTCAPDLRRPRSPGPLHRVRAPAGPGQTDGDSPSTSRATNGSTTSRPRMPSSHSTGIPRRPNRMPASPPAMHAVVSVSWP